MKVFVGLSGGVDSAVSAALLKNAGHDVVGAFIKIWQPEFLECTWKEDRLDAMRVCAALGIPFREIDLSQEYQREVIQEMIADYERGVTPNPDVLCNRSIKFGHFSKWAVEQGADAIATGHYARVKKDGALDLLVRAVDASKDQSYFLYRLTADDLARVLFPIGEHKKTEVRVLAQQFGLPNEKKHDSQGLCFVGDVSMKEFLSRFIPLTQGDVVDHENVVIGRHDGAALYTIGERHGLAVRGGEPQYVTEVDVKRNIIRVSATRSDAAVTAVTVRDVTWTGDRPKKVNLLAQARYHETPFAVTIQNSEQGSTAFFAESHIAAPGQSLVFYDDEICLGGGVITPES